MSLKPSKQGTSSVKMVRKADKDILAKRVKWKKDELLKILGLEGKSESEQLEELLWQYPHTFALEEDE